MREDIQAADSSIVEQLYRSIGTTAHAARGDPSVARIEVHRNRVLGVHLVPGLEVEADETDTGITAEIRVRAGTVVEKPVQVCFGMIPESGLQQINLDIRAEENSRAAVLAHCTFPFAQDIRHEMEASITVEPGAEYSYLERHVHGPSGGVVVVPKTRVRVLEGARYRTDFELVRGRAGEVDVDLEVTGSANSVTEIVARIGGSEDDRILINESAHLVGAGARAVLQSYVALRDRATADIRNTLTADAAGARGHVDCKEIVRDQAVAKAVPVVQVNHPQAHVTHEAAIGGVDAKQLATLMSRGLTEDEAVDLIIQGLLS